VKDELASAISLGGGGGRPLRQRRGQEPCSSQCWTGCRATPRSSLPAKPEYDTTVDVAAYLQQLCRAISRAELAGAGIELLLSVHPLRINADRCWLLGMIVFELIADAARHSFRLARGRYASKYGRQAARSVLHFG
jgi:hypothetical protein